MELILSRYTIQDVGKWVRRFRNKLGLSTFALANKIQVSPLLVELVEHSASEEHGKLIELLSTGDIESLVRSIQAAYDLHDEAICNLAAADISDETSPQHEITFSLPFTLTAEQITALMDQALQFSIGDSPYREQRDIILQTSVASACLLIKLLRSHLIREGCETEAQACVDQFSQTVQSWRRRVS